MLSAKKRNPLAASRNPSQPLALKAMLKPIMPPIRNIITFHAYRIRVHGDE
jgi:hypothetical protein